MCHSVNYVPLMMSQSGPKHVGESVTKIYIYVCVYIYIFARLYIYYMATICIFLLLP